MARGAGGGETCGDVIWIRGACEVRLVAGVAIGGSAYKDVVDVARCAWHGNMRASQWEWSVVVIEHRAGP